MPSQLATVPVLTAMIAQLMADATLGGLLARAPASFGGPGIYSVVPQGAARPYLRVGAGTEIPFNTMGPGSALKWGGTCTVPIKAVVERSLHPGIVIVSRVKTVLDAQPLVVDGYRSAIVAWDSLQDPFPELVDGVQLWHVPAFLTVTVHES